MEPTPKHPTSDEPADLEAIYQAYWSRLVRTASMMCGSREEAEDIVHDSFLRLASCSALPEHPLAYLRQVVVNLVRDRHRGRIVALRHRPPLGEVVLEAEDALIWTSVMKLPVRQRQALVLRYHDDLSLDAIAEILGCEMPGVKSLLHRGLTTLRTEMETHG